LRGVGLQLQCPFIASNGMIDLPLCRMHRAQVQVSFGIFGEGLDSLVEMELGLLELSKPLQSYAEVIMSLREIRLQAHCLAITVDRFEAMAHRFLKERKLEVA